MLNKVDEQKIFRSTTVLKATFTVVYTTNVYTSNAHGLVDGDKVRVSNSGGALPSGLSASTDYYVINSDTNTFGLSTTAGGSAVTITGNGTGTNSINVKGKVINCDGYSHVKLSYITAGTSTHTIKVQGSNSWDAPDFNSAVSVSNQWFYKQIKNEATAAAVDGATGIASSGTDLAVEYEVNVNAVRWLTLEVTAFTQGTVEARVSLFNNTTV